MTVLLLHGGFVDDFLLDIVLPVLMFAGLYWWADRKSKREKAAKQAAAAAREQETTSVVRESGAQESEQE